MKQSGLVGTCFANHMHKPQSAKNELTGKGIRANKKHFSPPPTLSKQITCWFILLSVLSWDFTHRVLAAQITPKKMPWLTAQLFQDNSVLCFCFFYVGFWCYVGTWKTVAKNPNQEKLKYRHGKDRLTCLKYGQVHIIIMIIKLLEKLILFKLS